MSIDLKFVELTAVVLETCLYSTDDLQHRLHEAIRAAAAGVD